MVAYFQEFFVGKGVLEQYGLPYDEGAVLISGGTGLPSIIGLVFAVIFVAGLSYGGEYLNNEVLGDGSYKGTKLPFNPLSKN